METTTHQQLKRLAMVHLLRMGCPIAALEVVCSIPRWRVDVAGWQEFEPATRIRLTSSGTKPEAPASTLSDFEGASDSPLLATPPPPPWPWGEKIEPRAIFIECKQSRGDFLRDRQSQPALVALKTVLEQRLRYLEEQWIKPREPHLRKARSSLFGECEEWDFASSQLATYHWVLKRLARVEHQISGETKFHWLSRYRLADQLFLAAPQGLLTKDEVPSGWGLLECAPRLLVMKAAQWRDIQSPLFEVVLPAPRLSCTDTVRQRVLRQISAAATRMALDGMWRD